MTVLDPAALDRLEALVRAWKQDGDPRFIGADIVLALVEAARERDALRAERDRLAAAVAALSPGQAREAWRRVTVEARCSRPEMCSGPCGQLSRALDAYAAAVDQAQAVGGREAETGVLLCCGATT